MVETIKSTGPVQESPFTISHPLIYNTRLIDDSLQKTISGHYWRQISITYVETEDKRATIEIDTSKLNYPKLLHAWLFFPEIMEERRKLLTPGGQKVVFELGTKPIAAGYASLAITDNEWKTLYARAVIFKVGKDIYEESGIKSKYPVASGNLDISEDAIAVRLTFSESRPKIVECLWQSIGYVRRDVASDEEVVNHTFTFPYSPDIPKGIWLVAMLDEQRCFLAQFSFGVR